MSFSRLPLLVCAFGCGAFAQETAPSPVPPPAPVAAPAPADPAVSELALLKAELEGLQKRLRQQGEDEVLRGAELRKGQEDLQKKLAVLEALPEEVKLALGQAKAAAERGTAEEKAQAALAQARLAGERQALVSVLNRLASTQKDLQGLGPLLALDKALAQFQEGTALLAQPAFTAVLAVLKDKLLKGPLGNPLKDPLTMGAYFANANLGANWLVAAVPMGPGWDGDKLKNLERALAAVDVATRMEVEVKAAQVLIATLKAEVALQQAAVDETLKRVSLLLDPAATGAGALEGELATASAEAAFKPLLAAAGAFTPAHRETLAGLRWGREEAQARLLEHRFLLRRLLGVTGGLEESFHTFGKEAPGKDLPALATLVKAIEAAKVRFQAIQSASGPEGKELAQLEAATYR